MGDLSAERHNELRELQYHWSDDDGHDLAYLFRYEDGRWIAARADNGREVTANSPGELRTKVIDDYSECPVPRKGMARSVLPL